MQSIRPALKTLEVELTDKQEKVVTEILNIVAREELSLTSANIIFSICKEVLQDHNKFMNHKELVSYIDRKELGRELNSIFQHTELFGGR